MSLRAHSRWKPSPNHHALFAVAQACLDVQFWFPLWLVFLLDKGFTLTEAALADTVFRIAVVVLEIPMGWVADRIGRGRAYLIACSLTVVTFVGIVFISEIYGLLLIWVLWALQWSLLSGLGGSLSYDLASLRQDSQRQGHFAALRSASLFGVLVSLFMATPLYELFPELPFLLTAILGATAGALTLWLPRLDSAPTEHMPEDSRNALHNSFPLILASATVLTIGWSPQVLYQPLAMDCKFDALSVSLMFVLIAILGIIGTLVGGRLKQSPRVLLAITGCIMSLFCCLSSTFPEYAAFVFIPGLAGTYSCATTSLEFALSRSVAHRYRAMALSVASMLGGLLIAISRPMLLLTAGSQGTQFAFGIWGGFTMLLLIFSSITTWKRLG